MRSTGQPSTSAGDPSYALELSGLTAGYGRTTVLRDIDVRVGGGGQVVALLGANGAGKTTLLKAASGLLPKTSGEVAIDGAPMFSKGPHSRARAGLCLIPDGRGVFRNLTVRENLRLQIPPWIKDQSLESAFDAFPAIRDRRSQTVGTMSGGQQQMVALSRCFLARPKVVLLDEVSIGLAPKTVDDIFASLLTLTDHGVSVLLVEQYIGRALEMADYVYLLSRGAISFSGPPSALDEDWLLHEYLGTDGDGTRHATNPLPTPATPTEGNVT